MALTILTDLLPLRLSGANGFIKVNTDKVSQPNIRIECAVLYDFWDTAGIILGVESLTPDADGICVFDISEYLGNPLKPGFSYPAANTFTLLPFASAKFKIIVSEWYGNPPVQDAVIVNPATYFPVKGAVPEYFHHDFFSAFPSWQNKLLFSDAIMSFQHLASVLENKTFERRIYKSDIQKIFVHSPVNTTGLNIQVDLSFSDGSTDKFQLDSSFQLLKGQVAEIECGHDHLNITNYIIANHPGKSLSFYTIKIFDVTTLLCPAYKYVLDPDYYPTRREFIFRNSAGGYDTFIAAGEAETFLAYDYQLANIPYWPSSANLGLTQNLRTDISYEISANTGFISEDVLNWLPEMFSSVEAYEILNGRLIPIAFKPGTIIKSRDADGLYFAEFKYFHVPDLIDESI